MTCRHDDRIGFSWSKEGMLKRRESNDEQQTRNQNHNENENERTRDEDTPGGTGSPGVRPMHVPLGGRACIWLMRPDPAVIRSPFGSGGKMACPPDLYLEGVPVGRLPTFGHSIMQRSTHGGSQIRWSPPNWLSCTKN